MSDPLDLTVGDVQLLLARCFDAPESPKIVHRLEYLNGEIPVAAQVGETFHYLKVVRIVETDFEFAICVQDPDNSNTILSSNRILKHSVKRVVYA